MFAASFAHEKEVNRYDNQFKLNPNLETYAKLDEVGALLNVIAREDRRLCGYAIFLVMNHMHYSIPWAGGDGFWLDKTARRPRVASRMIRFCESSLRDRGVILLTIPAPPKDQKMMRLLVAAGYELSSSAYSRRL